MLKRKRGYAPSPASNFKRRRVSAGAARPRVVPGFTRRAGFYGRYGQAAIAAGLTPEVKFFDTALSFTFDNTGEVPATGQLALIPQGDTQSTRDGRECVLKSVQIRGALVYTPGAAAAPTANSYMYLIQDTQANGAAAAVTDVFTSADLWAAHHNLANSDRFRILKKWKWDWNVQAGATTAYCNMTRQMEFYKKCDIKMQYSSTTGAVAEIKSNNLFLVAGGLGVDDGVAFAGSCRLRFVG